MPRDEVVRAVERALRLDALTSIPPLEIVMVDFSGPCAVCGTHVNRLAERGSYPVRSERMCPAHRNRRWFKCWLCNWWWLGSKRVSSEICIVCMQEVCTWCSELKAEHTRARLCLDHRSHPMFCNVCFTHAQGTYGNCWMCAVRCCEGCSEDVGAAPPQRECINCALDHE